MPLLYTPKPGLLSRLQVKILIIGTKGALLVSSLDLIDSLLTQSLVHEKSARRVITPEDDWGNKGIICNLIPGYSHPSVFLKLTSTYKIPSGVAHPLTDYVLIEILPVTTLMRLYEYRMTLVSCVYPHPCPVGRTSLT